MDIEILGSTHRVPILCQCRIEADEKEKVAGKKHKLQRRLELFKAYSLMDSRFEASTFENWEHSADNQGEYIIFTKYCERWDTMYKNNHGLLFHGKAGSGKTYLSFAIANALQKRGKAVMAISISKLLAIIKDSFDSRCEFGEASVLNAIKDAELLVLDDLGVEYKTAWVYEKLYNIIDTRYRVNKPLIITTNYSLDALRENLATIDLKANARDPSERIFSRITEMCAFHEIKGSSRRIIKGSQNKSALLRDLGILKG